ncbi:MAG: NAD(P)H-dependent oxidoreductase [Dehalococcoidia bacterium]|nr:NAD(P)H-dependent oxidoreductase [Dehalococcoidia bacterium]
MAGKVKIKLLGINCAMRRRNTAWLILYALKAAEKFGRKISQVAEIQTEFIDMSGYDRKAQPDVAPWPYADLDFDPDKTPDDVFAREILPRVREADGFIFGSGVHHHSFTSRYIKLIERLNEAARLDYLEGKPAGAIGMATMRKGGQDVTLGDMNNSLKALGLILVSFGNGVNGISGPPFGPFSMNDDHKVVASKNDELGQRLAVGLGRRVAEFALMRKIAKQKLGDLYTSEFVTRLAE